MKQTYFLRIILPVILFLCLAVKVYAQPEGANMANAINAGTLSPGVPFTDTKNNYSSNGYGNDMGQYSDDIYYKFTLYSLPKLMFLIAHPLLIPTCICWMLMVI